jgi:hypothetical protein
VSPEREELRRGMKCSNGCEEWEGELARARRMLAGAPVAQLGCRPWV